MRCVYSVSITRQKAWLSSQNNHILSVSEQIVDGVESLLCMAVKKFENTNNTSVSVDLKGSWKNGMYIHVKSAFLFKNSINVFVPLFNHVEITWSWLHLTIIMARCTTPQTNSSRDPLALCSFQMVGACGS